MSSPVELGHEDPSVDSTALVVHNSLPLAPMLMQSLGVHVSLPMDGVNVSREGLNQVNVLRMGVARPPFLQVLLCMRKKADHWSFFIMNYPNGESMDT